MDSLFAGYVIACGVAIRDDIIRLFNEGKVPPELINTSNCRKMAMRLRRHCEGIEPASFPKMNKLFEGSNGDRLQLLRSWLSCGEVPEQVEMDLEVKKSSTQMGEAKEELLTIIGMQKAGVSETLGWDGVLQMICIYIIIYILRYWGSGMFGIEAKDQGDCGLAEADPGSSASGDLGGG